MIKIFLLLIVSFSYGLIFPMDKPIENSKDEILNLAEEFSRSMVINNGTLPEIPDEILKLILLQKIYDYPWHEIIHVFELRTVSKKWYCILADLNAIAQILNIKPLHFQCVRNQGVDKIIDLKLIKGHSLLEPDDQGYRPAHYAVGTKNHKAMKLLKIAFALEDCVKAPNETCPNPLISFVIDKDEKSLQFLVAYPESFDNYDEGLYTKQQVQNILANNILDDIEDMFLNSHRIGQLLIDQIRDYVNSDTEKSLKIPSLNRIIFILSGVLEYMLFAHIQRNVDPGPELFEAFKQFQGNPNTCNGRGIPLLNCIARKSEFREVIPRLLEIDMIDINKFSAIPQGINGTALHAAVLSGHYENTKLLLDRKECDVNAKRSDTLTALHIAVEIQRPDIVELLLQYGADVNATDIYQHTPLHSAAQWMNLKVMELLLAAPGVNSGALCKCGHTPLVKAIRNNRLELAKLLIRYGANIHFIDNCNRTLLHHATIEPSIDCLRELRKIQGMRALLEVKMTLSGHTALFFAVKKGSLEGAKLLLTIGADVDALDNRSQTPLHFAAFNGHKSCVELLLSQGADINKSCDKNIIQDGVQFGAYTPLHFAAHNGHAEIVKLLLENLADLHAISTSGKTPLDLAREYNHDEVVKILENWEKDYE